MNERLRKYQTAPIALAIIAALLPTDALSDDVPSSTVVPREEWVNTNYGNNKLGFARGAPVCIKTQGATIHHTDTNVTLPGDCDPFNPTAVCLQAMNTMLSFHTRSKHDKNSPGRGWDDIGYNYVVDPNGVVYEGRDRVEQVCTYEHGEAKCSHPKEYAEVKAAHARPLNNACSLGVALIGNFVKNQPTARQISALTNFLANKFAELGINPNEPVLWADYSTYPPDYMVAAQPTANGHPRFIDTPIVYHDELQDKDCPGNNLKYYYLRTSDDLARNDFRERLREDIFHRMPANLRGPRFLSRIEVIGGQAATNIPMQAVQQARENQESAGKKRTSAMMIGNVINIEIGDSYEGLTYNYRVVPWDEEQRTFELIFNGPFPNTAVHSLKASPEISSSGFVANVLHQLRVGYAKDEAGQPIQRVYVELKDGQSFDEIDLLPSVSGNTLTLELAPKSEPAWTPAILKPLEASAINSELRLQIGNTIVAGRVVDIKMHSWIPAIEITIPGPFVETELTSYHQADLTVPGWGVTVKEVRTGYNQSDDELTVIVEFQSREDFVQVFPDLSSVNVTLADSILSLSPTGTPAPVQAVVPVPQEEVVKVVEPEKKPAPIEKPTIHYTGPYSVRVNFNEPEGFDDQRHIDRLPDTSGAYPARSNEIVFAINGEFENLSLASAKAGADQKTLGRVRIEYRLADIDNATESANRVFIICTVKGDAKDYEVTAAESENNLFEAWIRKKSRVR
jgi:hypothetical protein